MEETHDSVAGAAGAMAVEELVGSDGVFGDWLFLETLEWPPPPRDLPASQWQEALGRRLLTPDEVAARRRHFEQRERLAMARLAMAG